MTKDNSKISMKGDPLKVRGEAIKEGMPMPAFRLTGLDMKDIEPAQLANKTLVIVVVPSLDTPVCAIESKRFSKEVEQLGDDVTIMVVSRDLPFAQKRWCGAEGVTNLFLASDYKYRTFGEQFGVELPDMGLLARAVFVKNKAGKVTYVEYVPDISQEPNYEEVLKAVQSSR